MGKDSNRFPLDVGKGRWFHGKRTEARGGPEGSVAARIAYFVNVYGTNEQAAEKLSFCHSERFVQSWNRK